MKWPTLFILLAYSLLTPSLAQPKGIVIYASEVKKVTFSDEIEALGTLRANEHVSLAATVTEVVTAVHFDDNQHVKRGDILLEMDISEELAQLSEEQSRLEYAKRQLERLEPLGRKGATSESVLDDIRLEVETAEARIQAIRARIDLRRIIAPFDGVVGLRNVSIGSLVKSDTIITTIDDESTMKLDFNVPSLYLEALKPGMHIQATTKAFASHSFSGAVSAINSRIDPITRSVTVRARINNPDHLLKPGLLMRVRLNANPRKSLLVPESSVYPNGEKNFVLAVTEDHGKKTVERREVLTGTRKNGYVEVLKGLHAGELVVSQGLMKVKPGDSVIVKAIENKGDTLQHLLKQAGGI